MLRTSMTLIGLAGAALLAGSFTFAESRTDSWEESRALLKAALLKQIPASPKGDRLAGPVSSGQRTSISIIEIVGASQATIILRASNGEVIYRSDPRTGITTFSKNADFPVLTVNEQVQSPAPAVQHPPVLRREGGEEPRKPKRSTPVGCMGDVSPLAKASANRMPSLCLA